MSCQVPSSIQVSADSPRDTSLCDKQDITKNDVDSPDQIPIDAHDNVRDSSQSFPDTQHIRIHDGIARTHEETDATLNIKSHTVSIESAYVGAPRNEHGHLFGEHSIAYELDEHGSSSPPHVFEVNQPVEKRSSPLNQEHQDTSNEIVDVSQNSAMSLELNTEYDNPETNVIAPDVQRLMESPNPKYYHIGVQDSHDTFTQEIPRLLSNRNASPLDVPIESDKLATRTLLPHQIGSLHDVHVDPMTEAPDQLTSPYVTKNPVKMDAANQKTPPLDAHQDTSKVPRPILHQSTVIDNVHGMPDDPEWRPSTKTWQQITIGMYAFGMELCYATETALLVPILLQLGLPERFYSITWFVSPVLGFIMQPLIGSCSDMCTSFWGRRRPFLLAFGFGIVLGFALLLNGEDIGLKLGDLSTDHTIGIALTMIGVIILDWCCDSSDTPGRSYILDIFNPDDLENAFNYRAFLSGLGIGIGYIVNAIHWDQTSLGKAFGGQLHVVFFLNGTMCVLAMITTLCSVKETPLGDLKTKKCLMIESSNHPGTGCIQNNGLYDDLNTTNTYGTFLQDSASKPSSEEQRSRSGSVKSQISQRSHISFSGSSGHEGTDLEWDNSFDDRHFYDDGLITSSDNKPAVLHGHIQFDTHDEASTPPREDKTPAKKRQRSKSTASLKLEDRDRPASALQLLYSIVKMPKELRRLCINHYLSWTAMLPVYLFFTDYVGQAVYHGDPQAPLNSTARIDYQQGVRMGCWGMCVFALSATLSAVIYGRLLQLLSYRALYVWTQVLFAVGTGMQAMFSDHKYVTLALCMTFGFMYTSIMITPYSILADFHKTETYVKNCGDQNHHKRGLGTDVACLTCMIFLAQITVSSYMGPLVNAIGTHLVVVLSASMLAFVSAIAASVFVIYEIHEEMEEEKEVEEENKEEWAEDGQKQQEEEDNSGSFEEDDHQPLLLS